MLSAPPVVGKKRVVCETCGCELSQQSNLTRHIETKHPDLVTPDAVDRRLKLKESRNTGRRKRRLADPVFRENERQQNQTNRMNKKNKNAHIAGDADASTADTSTATEAEKNAEEKNAESEESAYPGQCGGGARDIRVRQLNMRH
jgi:hypothetical protein